MTQGNPLIKTIVDFVEGRLPALEFQAALYDDPAYGDLLADERGEPDRWVVEGTYVFVISQNFHDIVAVSRAQQALSAWLNRHAVPNILDTSHGKLYEVLLDACPSWLDVNGEYYNQLLAESEGRQGGALKKWLKAELRRRFVSVKRPPRWVQSPAWPIGPNGPLVFLGQLSVGEYFHDSGFVYVFLDPADGTCTTVVQVH